jgi:ATP-dependent exoDNAse (exonuclease V) alpha subunit
VLVMADTFQLPPVSGYGYFTEAAPEIMLTDVRRQAENNPIIRMSLDIREGRSLAYGSYGDSRVVRRSQINSDEVLSADQVLVGTNKTRFKFNGRVRELRGFATRQGRNDALPMNPVRGDRLVCLKNDRNKGLLNGGLWSVERVELNRRGNYVMQLVSLDLDSRGRVTSSVETPPAFFDGTFADLPWEERKNCDEFDFGYALTVHKSQGSQFDNPMLFDESDVFGENAARHRYTGVTRAVDTITIVR